MEVLQEQQGNQGCPNLNAKSILGGSDESLYLQMLFEGLEKHLDLPSVFINGGDGGGAKAQVIGQKNDFAVILFVPDHHAPEKIGAFDVGLGTDQPNDLV